LDEVHPFSDTAAVDVLVRESGCVLSADVESAGARNASRIWGFMSKFVLLDRFLKALGLVVNCPGQAVPRSLSCPDYFGTASKVIFFFLYLLYCLMDSF
jgi:hypothetical protein